MSKTPSNIDYEKLMILGMFGLYFMGGLFVPVVPYHSDVTLIYPLLILYKHLFFHILIVLLGAICAVYFVFFRKVRIVLPALLLLGLLILIACMSVFSRDYRHHDSQNIDDTVYQLGTSNGSDWATLEYLVYQCDRMGLICKLVDIPYSGLDRSQLPTGTLADRYASFFLAGDDLFISIQGNNYSVRLKNP